MAAATSMATMNVMAGVTGAVTIPVASSAPASCSLGFSSLRGQRLASASTHRRVVAVRSPMHVRAEENEQGVSKQVQELIKGQLSGKVQETVEKVQNTLQGAQSVAKISNQVENIKNQLLGAGKESAESAEKESKKDLNTIQSRVNALSILASGKDAQDNLQDALEKITPGMSDLVGKVLKDRTKSNQE